MRARPAARYDRDFYGWTQDQAALLRGMAHQDTPLDVEHLADEIEDMGRAELAKISGLLRQTLIHLLKLAIDPGNRANQHWLDEVIAFQGEAALTISSGLMQRISLAKIWLTACHGAVNSLRPQGVAIPALPATCPLTLAGLLSETFDPSAAIAALTAALEAERNAGP